MFNGDYTLAAFMFVCCIHFLCISIISTLTSKIIPFPLNAQPAKWALLTLVWWNLLIFWLVWRFSLLLLLLLLLLQLLLMVLLLPFHWLLFACELQYLYKKQQQQQPRQQKKKYFSFVVVVRSTVLGILFLYYFVCRTVYMFSYNQKHKGILALTWNTNG